MFFLDAYTNLKDLLGALLRLAPDALHVHVGIAIFFAVALLVRTHRPFLTAYWVVLAVAVAAEVFDLLYDLQLGHRLRWLNSVKDIANAMVWPTAWMLVGPKVVRLMLREGLGLQEGLGRSSRTGAAQEEGRGRNPAGMAAAGRSAPVPHEHALATRLEGVAK